MPLQVDKWTSLQVGECADMQAIFSLASGQPIVSSRRSLYLPTLALRTQVTPNCLTSFERPPRALPRYQKMASRGSGGPSRPSKATASSPTLFSGLSQDNLDGDLLDNGFSDGNFFSYSSSVDADWAAFLLSQTPLVSPIELLIRTD